MVRGCPRAQQVGGGDGHGDMRVGRTAREHHFREEAVEDIEMTQAVGDRETRPSAEARRPQW